MSADRGHDDDGETADTADWPVSLSGVTESIVTTLGPNGLWNAAPLGLFADGDGDGPITARTWGKTRTRGNFHRQGEGYVQFVDDPVVFADAALSIVEGEEPILESANAWTRVTVESLESGTDDGTDWERWALHPVDAEIRRERVPTIDRGFGAVIEATVAASRLGVAGYDDADLRERLEYCASVVDRAGSPRERKALERVREHSNW
ncbi:DUF447 domain-containing protein [Natronorubrum sulfidifaciens]|uniref:DUF447 family protein n=1 Tax=Natronorubrum sulfidifaciens JCM 14089 TaxID=1230460 RepID=L9W2S3_9EURY|nr:DUF447 domain-containing protein [Natronorubrum sulfidifaciens]ELY42618.1 hypothetical protein C495_14932 [Natronorubrum sulfidifaciens JCM 14089]